MITMKELNPSGVTNTTQDLDNLKILLERINKVRSLFGKPMIVTSGYRTMADHLRIYKQIAARNKVPFDSSKVPMKSRHLYGNAVDIADPNADLYRWCLAHDKELREIGLWLENRQGPWVHFQCVPFGSYKKGKSIWFNP